MHAGSPLLWLSVFAVAFLYSTVGHAGASGYIAVMALLGMSPQEIKPTALMLNVVVASLGSFQFWRAGHFRWALFWPFALASVPCAFVGGYLTLPTAALKLLLGVVLLLSAARLLARPTSDEVGAPPSPAVALSTGAGLGLLSGLTGTGGGIFLTPVLLFMRWARAKEAAAVSAMFILVNSLSGLLGQFGKTGRLPLPAVGLALAALTGGLLGSQLGSAHLSHVVIKRWLALVLVIAGGKLLAGG